MNFRLWRKFNRSVFNPIFHNRQSYVDLSLVSKDEFPALYLLKDFSTLEILVLAQFILFANNIKEDEKCCSEEFLHEIFENYNYTKKELYDAAQSIAKNGWAEEFVDLYDGYIHYKANLKELNRARLYYYTI